MIEKENILIYTKEKGLPQRRTNVSEWGKALGLCDSPEKRSLESNCYLYKLGRIYRFYIEAEPWVPKIAPL